MQGHVTQYKVTHGCAPLTRSAASCAYSKRGIPQWPILGELLMPQRIGVPSDDISVFAVSLVVSGVIVALTALQKVSVRPTGRAFSIQNVHCACAPRLGGISIFAAMILMLAFTSGSLTEWFGLLIAASSMIFVAGLAEDIGFNVSARRRLFASLASAILAIVLLEAWLPRVDIRFIDNLIELWWLGIPFTILLTAGTANAFNMVDGLHGLAAGLGAVAAGAMAIISAYASYDTGLHLSAMLFFAIYGFYVINYPWGLIFLGDSGAYLLGFVISWFGIVILVNAPEVAVWAVFLTALMPACDMLLTISRRVSSRKAATKPDRMHLHHVVFRIVTTMLKHSQHRSLVNPISTAILLPLAIVPALLGIRFWDDPERALMSALVMMAGYVLFYQAAIRLYKGRKIPFVGGFRHSKHDDCTSSPLVRTDASTITFRRG
jgi:UDP-GlcNAc:undecaprenyl-phosphate/decaprenyl-phosphate GlcNAc-1-phosphate transferase